MFFCSRFQYDFKCSSIHSRYLSVNKDFCRMYWSLSRGASSFELQFNGIVFFNPLNLVTEIGTCLDWRIWRFSKSRCFYFNGTPTWIEVFLNNLKKRQQTLIAILPWPIYKGETEVMHMVCAIGLMTTSVLGERELFRVLDVHLWILPHFCIFILCSAAFVILFST